MPDDSTTRSVALLCAHREIEQKVYRKGKQEIRDQYTTTNITYPGHGRATREMDTNVLIGIDLEGHMAPNSHPYR